MKITKNILICYFRTRFSNNLSSSDHWSCSKCHDIMLYVHIKFWEDKNLIHHIAGQYRILLVYSVFFTKYLNLGPGDRFEWKTELKLMSETVWRLKAFDNLKLNNCRNRLNILGIKIDFMSCWRAMHLCIFHMHNPFCVIGKSKFSHCLIKSALFTPSHLGTFICWI